MAKKTIDRRIPIILAVLAGIAILVAIYLMLDRAIYAFMSAA